MRLVTCGGAVSTAQCSQRSACTIACAGEHAAGLTAACMGLDEHIAQIVPACMLPHWHMHTADCPGPRPYIITCAYRANHASQQHQQDVVTSFLPQSVRTSCMQTSYMQAESSRVVATVPCHVLAWRALRNCTQSHTSHCNPLSRMDKETAPGNSACKSHKRQGVRPGSQECLRYSLLQLSLCRIPVHPSQVCQFRTFFTIDTRHSQTCQNLGAKGSKLWR